jgi:hypothetical protein
MSCLSVTVFAPIPGRLLAKNVPAGRTEGHRPKGGAGVEIRRLAASARVCLTVHDPSQIIGAAMSTIAR